MKFLLSFTSSIFNPKQTILCGIQKGLKSFKVPEIFNISHTTTLPSLPWSSLGILKYIDIFKVQWMMLATSKILTLPIFKHLDAMAAPKLVLKCSASRNYHHFPSCISQLQSRNLCLTPLLCWHCSSNPRPGTQVRQGRKDPADFARISREIKCRKYFFI